MNWKDTEKFSHCKNENWYCNIDIGYHNKWYWEIAYIDSFTDPLDDRIYTGTSNTREEAKLACENKLMEIENEKV